ncbi:MAG: tripartite tricarboxylate transporter substrate binding protein [Hyphomicrobiales bacterium]|nr:tripartite tricarboxylate transporter substrate binding protein [Hyphomicrobiales bacterium]
MKPSIAAVLWALLPAIVLPAAAEAQPYPSRPIRFIVPFPAGGVADVTARLIGQRLGDALGQSIVIENRTGASGTLGVDAATKATPDGYTLLFTTGDFITTPTLMPKMAFDPFRDLIPIVQAATAPLLLGGHAAGSIGSVKDLVAQAKANPGKIAYSSPGNGTINQLAVEWLAIEAKLKLLHVPYRGGAPAAVAVAAGDVPIGALTPSSAQPLVEAGKVKVLALMTRQRPTFAPPDWPTLDELGFAVDAALWVALFAPSGTPKPVVERLDREVLRILKDEAVRKRLNALGTEASGISQAVFVERIKADAARYLDIIRQTGIRADQ